MTMRMLAALATQPLAWVALLLAVALWQLWRQRLRPGLRGVAAALALLLLLGWLPAPLWLMQQLEQRHAPATGDLSRFSGIVVLGGAFAGQELQEGRAQSQLNAHADRLTEAAAWARLYPRLRMVFTGGCMDPPDCRPEADLARRFFERMGLPADRFMYESTSRTTFENARNTARLPGIDRRQPWLLLTSAWHMPRAMATFRAQGWNVTPLPADFRGLDRPDWGAYSLGTGVEYWQLLLHEVIGLIAYRMTGQA